jgi:hypothetical protein
MPRAIAVRARGLLSRSRLMVVCMVDSFTVEVERLAVL